MKKYLVFSLLFTLTSYVFAQIPEYVSSTGLAAWWSFTGNANDESGNNNNGTPLYATLAPDRNGNPNSAYYFNGTNAKVSIASQPNLNINSSLSISVWVKPEKKSGQIFWRGNSQSGMDPYFIAFLDSCVYFRRYVNTGTTACHAKFDTTLLIPNVYNHIVATYNQTNNQYRLYLNGTLQNEAILPGTISYSTSGMSNYIGGVNDNSQAFKGFIDDIGVWNRVLTQSEITLLYEGCNHTINLTSQILSQPIGSNCSITANTTYTNTLINWQTNITGLGWLYLPENNIYVGVDSNILTINNILPNNYNQEFRAVSNYMGCKDTSDIAVMNLIDTLYTIHYDTTQVTVFDTLYTTIYDTTFTTIFDTLYTTIYDTLYTTIFDTLYTTIYDTTFTTIFDTTYISVTDTLIIDTPLSINPSIVNTIKIYPNPASTYIYIDYGSYALMNGYRLQITNSIGQILFNTNINQQTSYIDLSSWSGNGLYIVTILNPQNTIIETRKIILQ